MILGLDVSTSITGATVLNLKEEILYCEAWKLQNKKHFPDLFSKAEAVKNLLIELNKEFDIEEVYIESPLWISRGKSSAKTILTLARFNGIVGWIVKDVTGITPEFITASQARTACGVGKRDKSVNIKQHILNFLLDSEPNFCYDITKHGNPVPGTYDRADSLVIAKAGVRCHLGKKQTS
jgi:Holliday junction resolvasome RuvABC endonuclease subunit